MKKINKILSLSSFLLLVACGGGEITSNPISSSISSEDNLFSEMTSSTESEDNSSSEFSTDELYTEIPPISEEFINTYKVTWVNYNGDVLETDRNVVEGSFPSYEGNTPTREKDEEYYYVFDSWSPELSEVVCDITYTATYKALPINNEEIEGVIPTFSNDKKTVKYGFYPQSYVSDTTLIEKLNALEAPSLNDWYLYEGNYYIKETANVFNGETTYKFNNGTSIVNGSSYWFKCAPIVWKVLKESDDSYLLLAENALDSAVFNDSYKDEIVDDKTIYANNYEYSYIREYLNNDFYNQAFALNSDYIKKADIDNSESTTDLTTNKYVCNETKDNVSLLSYKDYLTIEYGFDGENNTSNSRIAYTSDYARIKGIYCNKDKSYSSSYWTRSPSSNFSYSAWNVNTGGYLSEYMVNSTSHSIRPSITIYSIN